MSSGTYTVASYNPVNDAESNFGNRLTNYYVTADRCMERVQRQFPAERTEDLRKRYDAVLLAFYNDPVKNPLTLPTTSREIKYFLKKCDECTLINPDSVHVDECLRMICVVNHGVQFITQRLNSNENGLRIMKQACEQCMLICHPDVVARMAREKGKRYLCETFVLGDVLILRTDVPDNREFRFVDHGSSATLGEFWTYEEILTPELVGVQNPIIYFMSVEDFDARFVQKVEKK